ncbi:unnamed protein product [Pseudo-nitzschia multistriata]|uniref:Leucine-rich repeat-containing N-terminal plant-type domain-containing protein n=1 Tax=Pseudo-nitzschia multistriata TaxID=183589 RepID=A0A448Z9J7_9STRA|nr:unnamed protein product [Pseudo-nitzschia multistriata]
MTSTSRSISVVVIQLLLICTCAVLSAANANNNDENGKNRFERKRINGNGDVTNEMINNRDDTAREYLESLWDNFEDKQDQKVQGRRLAYLESMMDRLLMSMSMPTKSPSSEPPNSKTPTAPITPTEFPTSKEPTDMRPTRSPLPGPTLPTRVPIPTKAPINAPSEPFTYNPVEVPTLPNPPTPAPFSAPTRPCIAADKERNLYQAVSSTTDRSVFLNINTPQGMAYSFLLEEEPSFICSPTLMQRYGLSTFYFATNGDSWTNNLGWLTGVQECNWFGVKCNEGLFATSLNLALNNANGIIPNEISAVSTLQKVDLFSNSITGKLPNRLSRLSSLVTLDLQDNLLTGDAFPRGITSLERLVSYRISNNQLTGSISADITSLRRLKELWAGNNMISGSIPSNIGDLRDLKTVYVNNNALTGRIPSELGLIPLEGLSVLFQIQSVN